MTQVDNADVRANAYDYGFDNADITVLCAEICGERNNSLFRFTQDIAS